MMAAGSVGPANGVRRSRSFEGNRPATSHAQTMTQVVQLPLVEVTGKRADSGTALARTDSTEPAARKVQ